jgi:hypothetical protein
VWGRRAAGHGHTVLLPPLRRGSRLRRCRRRGRAPAEWRHGGDTQGVGRHITLSLQYSYSAAGNLGIQGGGSSSIATLWASPFLAGSRVSRT